MFRRHGAGVFQWEVSLGLFSSVLRDPLEEACTYHHHHHCCHHEVLLERYKSNRTRHPHFSSRKPEPW